MSRETLKTFLDSKKPVLEIGPLDKPFITNNDYNVFYADINDSETIRKIYSGDSEVNCGNVKEIDFVIRETYEKAVGNMKFQAVFSSHVIEHIPDIISHLIDISRILEDDGYVVLAIPDKRYTYDCFREVTPFRDAFEAYNDTSTALPRLGFDSIFYYSPDNDAVLLWSGERSYQSIVADKEKYKNALSLWRSPNDAGFFHYWVFTYLSFLAFIRDGLRSRLLPYKLCYSKPAQVFANEFHIVLQKNADILLREETTEAEIRKIQDIITDPLSDSSPSRFMRGLSSFLKKYPQCYIYGAGDYGQNLLRVLHKKQMEDRVAGFIISDGYCIEGQKEIPVFNLSEVIAINADYGVIVAMTTQNETEVLPVLKRHQINYISMSDLCFYE